VRHVRHDRAARFSWRSGRGSKRAGSLLETASQPVRPALAGPQVRHEGGHHIGFDSGFQLECSGNTDSAGPSVGDRLAPATTSAKRVAGALRDAPASAADRRHAAARSDWREAFRARPSAPWAVVPRLARAGRGRRSALPSTSPRPSHLHAEADHRGRSGQPANTLLCEETVGDVGGECDRNAGGVSRQPRQTRSGLLPAILSSSDAGQGDRRVRRNRRAGSSHR
jgi:hypothetical protein